VVYVGFDLPLIMSAYEIRFDNFFSGIFVLSFLFEFIIGSFSIVGEGHFWVLLVVLLLIFLKYVNPL